MAATDRTFIVEYYYKQVDDILAFMEAIPGEYGIRDIHQLRVRIKRLKALFRLLEFIHPVEFRAKDHYRLFKPVFKTAGLIRESQININLLDKFKDTDKLKKSFAKYVAKLRPDWDANLDVAIGTFNHDRLKEINKKVEDLFSRNTEIELVGLITDYIYSEFNRIVHLLEESDDIEHIHDVRIILKNVKPVLGMLWPREDSVFEKAHYKSLNKTEKLIGNWHDRLVLSESLSIFFKARGKKKEKMEAEYLSLKKRINKYNRSALERIGKSLDATITFFLK